MNKLYLIPNKISADSEIDQIPSGLRDIIKSTDVYIVENIRNARRFIKSINNEKVIDDIIFFELNKHTDKNEIPSFLNAIENGRDIGLISEAGVPCVADPGSVVVELAHRKNIEVVPLVGPSSILLALMASGFNGQQFCFHGYLPINNSERVQKIKFIENQAVKYNQTQIFIETPYRNNQLFKELIKHCNDHTNICVASEILGLNASIKTKKVNQWKKKIPDLHKKTVVFLIGA